MSEDTPATSRRALATSERALFARMYDAVMAAPERLVLGDHREALAAGLSGRVLDVGSGTGATFPYYGPDTVVRGVEPDPGMCARARARAADLDHDIEVVDARAEDLPYPDDSFDAAVVALVLCTVTDVDAALDELARVLRPGGELRALEHVRGRGAVGRFHETLAPGWFRVAGGCHLDRSTGERLARADQFDLVEFTRFESGLTRLLPLVRARLERRRDSWLPW